MLATPATSTRPAAPTCGDCVSARASATGSRAASGQIGQGTRPTGARSSRVAHVRQARSGRARPRCPGRRSGRQHGRQRRPSRLKRAHLRIARAGADHRCRQAPNATAIDGAPLAASAGRRRSTASAGTPAAGKAPPPGARAPARRAASWASSGVVSWPSCSRPSVAISASSAPSADRARVVHRIGLAAEGEGHRLRGLGAREVVGGVPGEHQRQRPAAARTARARRAAASTMGPAAQ